MTWLSNASCSLGDIRRRHCALAILRCLRSCAGNVSNDGVLRDRLTSLGLVFTQDHLRTMLRALEDQGAVAMRFEGDCAVVTLTRAGSEVAVGTTVMEGVVVPDPDCPY